MNVSETPGRGKLLFADDDDLVRGGVGAILERRGFACVGVGSGAAAIEQLRAGPFDALIADINMPGNAGLELIMSIPQITSGLPVVLLTGRPTVETAAKSVRLAVTAYLTKPPDIDELCAILDQAIGDYRGFRALVAGRARLHTWDQELAEIEQTLRRAPDARAGGPMSSYLRLMLKQVILILSDVERATVHLEHAPVTSKPLEQIDHVAALRKTVEVLERTKQNFKSKDLADLRKQLELLLGKAGD